MDPSPRGGAAYRTAPRPQRLLESARPMTPSIPPLRPREAVRALYDRPLFALLDEARAVHRAHHPEHEVQLCTLLSVKTGGCPEDCAYCPQSSHYATDVGAGEDARRRRGAGRRARAPGTAARRASAWARRGAR